ncbi:hypothetical protein CCR85_13815 [Rhodothalassium salexigens]|uniref:PadR family transcriptional regulator n=1 Tax=Rhodothalassium salexigens TaxID=1086 RepID=UPI001913BEF2|nr:PadR family transcriptional regulator [Rhodothalassium salexigens]MBK5912563.1 hypothetical protein [Rhodothalassium salexigens]
MDVRTLCLGILSLGDATGYEIKKMVAEGSFSFFSEASYGSIYPALTKLTQDGLVACRTEHQERRPDKKVYSLTDAGRQALEGTLRDGPEPDRNRSDFLASLLFAEAVSPERLGGLIDARIGQHDEKIAALNRLLAEDMSPASRFVIEYGVATQKAARHFLVSYHDRLTADAPLSTKAAE